MMNSIMDNKNLILLFLNGRYISTFQELQSLFVDDNLTTNSDFKFELLAAVRDNVLSSWLDSQGKSAVLNKVNLDSSDSDLYSHVLKCVTGRDNIRIEKTKLEKSAELIKVLVDGEERSSFDSESIVVNKNANRISLVFKVISAINEAYCIELVDAANDSVVAKNQLNLKNITKDTEIQLDFHIHPRKEIKYKVRIDKEYLKFKSACAYSYSSPITITANSVSFNMIPVKAGTFTRGNLNFDAHQVTLTRNYYIGETQVTRQLWNAVMGIDSSAVKVKPLSPDLVQLLNAVIGRDSSGEDGLLCPVEYVSWTDCKKFIDKLNSITGRRFCLPTEAQWEYAARGGNKSKGYKYAGSDYMNEVGWCTGHSNDRVQEVKQLSPNELGIYDMSGNVWEWCNDLYGEYLAYQQTDPTGPRSGRGHVVRGGSCWCYADKCRVDSRMGKFTDERDEHIGLRLCLCP